MLSSEDALHPVDWGLVNGTAGEAPDSISRVEEIKARVITVSDRCASGAATDRSGPLALSLLAGLGYSWLRPGPGVVVPDGIDSVRGALRDALRHGYRLVVTTGGTGVSPRDLTPEATEPMLVARLDGLAEQIRANGGHASAVAGLSRGLVGVTSRDCQGALIVNAPGSTGGVRDTFAVIGPVLEHIFSQLAGGGH